MELFSGNFETIWIVTFSYCLDYWSSNRSQQEQGTIGVDRKVDQMLQELDRLGLFQSEAQDPGLVPIYQRLQLVERHLF